MDKFVFLLERGTEHPLIAVGVTLFLGIALVLGAMHEARLLADSLIPLIRHFKSECAEWRETWRRLKRELTIWKADL